MLDANRELIIRLLVPKSFCVCAVRMQSDDVRTLLDLSSPRRLLSDPIHPWPPSGPALEQCRCVCRQISLDSMLTKGCFFGCDM